MRSFLLGVSLSFILFLTARIAFAQGIVDTPLPDGSDAAEKSIPGLRIPEGMQVKLFAAEPQLASPVAICLDERGRVFVAEEYRFNRGTEENRTRPFLLEGDLQIRTLDDRLALFEKFKGNFAGGMEWFTRYTDAVRLLEDADGDGRAEKSTLFADGFNGVLDGMASGVIARDGDVYLTCIPHLWRLRDEDGDGIAEKKEKLLTGFGVNCGFLGHDLHGPAWGPDGKLYFSIGDRGYHVVTKEGATLSQPRRGAVFRCRPDGAELEVVHTGLRNPQELAFDEFGNLFADDNNCDKGDDARLVYVVEGGDSGWNMAYQTIPEPYLVGPWHAENMWKAASENPPAWLLPRIGKIGNGPSGFTYYPGVGLPERYRGRFFMCNYTGGGGIEAFAVKPQGAGFEMHDYHDFLKPLSATDADFGYDGKLYVSDFVGLDWSGKSKGGRIYTLAHAASLADPAVRETTELFRGGFAKLPNEKLASLLQHADMRVRQRAQFTLANRTDASLPIFVAAVKQQEHRLARLHGLWGLGQIADRVPAAKDAIAAALNDADVEVRAHAARLAGDAGCATSVERLIALLNDESPRVQFFAAQSLGKLKQKGAVEPLFVLVARNVDQDWYLRHACIYALFRIGDYDAVASRNKDADRAVRLASLLVLRLSGDDRIASFLNDDEPSIVLEAARAINDLHLDGHTAALANVVERFKKQPTLASDPLVRRIINAHFRLGGPTNAATVAKIAVNSLFSVPVRREAINALADWHSPGQRDRVTGFWRPVGPRDATVIETGLTSEAMLKILASSDGDLRKPALDMAMKLQVGGGDELLLRWVADRRLEVGSRAAALRLLTHRKHADADRLREEGRRDDDPRYRAAVLEIVADADPNAAETWAGELLAAPSSIAERQTALVVLTRCKSKSAEAILMGWGTKLADGSVPPELALDVVEACSSRNPPTLKQYVAAFQKTWNKDDSLARWRTSLVGGDAERGRTLFVNHGRAQCLRCHKVEGIGGGDAGPELSKVAMKNSREYLLESLIAPHAKIAAGFGSVTLTLTNGKVVAGTVKNEQEGVIEIVTPKNETLRIATADVDERTPPQSAMPAVDSVLTPRELRDVVEFLSTLK